MLFRTQVVNFLDQSIDKHLLQQLFALEEKSAVVSTKFYPTTMNG